MAKNSHTAGVKNLVLLTSFPCREKAITKTCPMAQNQHKLHMKYPNNKTKENTVANTSFKHCSSMTPTCSCKFLGFKAPLWRQPLACRTSCCHCLWPNPFILTNAWQSCYSILQWTYKTVQIHGPKVHPWISNIKKLLSSTFGPENMDHHTNTGTIANTQRLQTRAFKENKTSCKYI